MKTVAVVTATRAEYCMLIPLIRAIYEDESLQLRLLVTGTHLSHKHDYTIRDIEADGFPIAQTIPILSEDNTEYGISLTMANALKGFADCFRNCRLDMLIMSGDRTETLAIACAAMNERIPIGHIHGGEVTAGAVDDCVRHALSKMSYLHFTSTELYRKRVIQLGESPERVFCVGSLGTENILHAPLLSEKEIRREIGIPSGVPYAVVTFHPVTLEQSVSEQVNELCAALEKYNEIYYVITEANADTGGDIVNEILRNFAAEHKNTFFVANLGMVRYLSAVKYARFVLGNSSSGIIEAPVLGTPTVNIGDRQSGRMMAKTIVNCQPVKDDIVKAIAQAVQMDHIASYEYGDGTTSGKIVAIIKDFLLHDKINLKKGFYDIGFKPENQ